MHCFARGLVWSAYGTIRRPVRPKSKRIPQAKARGSFGNSYSKHLFMGGIYQTRKGKKQGQYLSSRSYLLDCVCMPNPFLFSSLELVTNRLERKGLAQIYQFCRVP